MKPPIEVVGTDRPRRFRWRQVVGTPTGARTIEHVGTVAPMLEDALLAMVACTDQLQAEVAELRAALDAANRRANAAEVLNSNQRQMLDEVGAKPATGGRRKPA